MELNLDEMGLTAAESRASYEEIKVYIAQVKRANEKRLFSKCGIIEKENYNKAKAEGVKVSKCPEKKERAIRKALEYFKMV